jgi:hypothetical protein
MEIGEVIGLPKFEINSSAWKAEAKVHEKRDASSRGMNEDRVTL